MGAVAVVGEDDARMIPALVIYDTFVCTLLTVGMVAGCWKMYRKIRSFKRK